MSEQKPTGKSATLREEKEKRLAEALRANLLRRKAQSSARRDAAAAAEKSGQ